MKPSTRWWMMCSALAGCVVSPSTNPGPSPADSGATNPADSGATNPADSGATNPADSGATNPADSGGTTPTDPCARRASCDTCTPVDGCGWCGASGRCVSGDDAGPTTGTCGGQWAWLPSECGGTTTTDGGTTTPPDASVGPMYACPGDRRITFDTDVRGDTSAAGWDANLTAWFSRSDVACSPATESANTRGPYQVYTIMMPPASDWAVELTPDEGVNANLAAVWTTSTFECSALLGHSVVTCEYSVRSRDGSASRSARLNATTRGYAMRILVNTPDGGRRGGFTLRVHDYP